MPYVRCPRCGCECYSAAAWTTRDECPSCLAPLVPGRDAVAVAATLNVRLPSGVTAPTKARAAVSTYVDGDRLDGDRLGDLLLLTSEVVTNAVVHAAPGTDHDVRLLLTRDFGVVRVAVVDPGPDLTPRLRPFEPTVPGGMGMVLVNMLAERWGVERRDERTKEVWFEYLTSQPETAGQGRGA